MFALMNLKVSLAGSPTTITPAEHEIVFAPVRVEKDEDVFPQGTTDLFTHVKGTASEAGLSTRIASSPARFVELAQHSIIVDFGILCAQWVVIPIVTNLIASYIYEKYRNPKDVEARLTIRTERGTIAFQGPGDRLGEVFTRARELLDARALPPAEDEVLDVSHLLEEDDPDDRPTT